uniref:Uncharacterized protein n=1 Tax=viral metagenome TaxID=1070528 RepID=A0A6M3MB17_9ZZZZ
MFELQLPSKEIQCVFYKIVSWFLVIFLIGFSTGLYSTKRWIIEPRLKEAISIGALVANGTVYDLKERIGE